MPSNCQFLEQENLNDAYFRAKRLQQVSEKLEKYKKEREELARKKVEVKSKHII
jgi:hypothetical protein